MQTFKIEVDDSVADKILWFLNNLNDVKIQKIDTASEVDDIVCSIQESIKEVKDLNKNPKSLQNAWDLVDEL